MKIGDYVRTEYGIAKCIKATPIRENSFLYEFDREVYEDVLYLTASELEKYKTSPNIIDLIEVGDYVNGKLVIEHAYQKGRLFVTNLYIGGKGFTTCEDYSWELTKENEDYIDSILTKEQFESMEYKVME